jgi:hypothetical protein
MSDKIIAGIDWAASEVSKLSDKMAYMYDKQLLRRLGMFTEPICSHCHVRQFQHITVMGETIMNHPFFNNNLEYLEWESKRRENV